MSSGYFINMEKIEELWKKAREGGFANRKDNDALFGACAEGRHLFWKYEMPYSEVLANSQIFFRFSTIYCGFLLNFILNWQLKSI